jgi:hypothetical protein
MRRGINKYIKIISGWKNEKVRLFVRQSGSGMIELILAMGVFAMMASALLSLTVGSYEGLLRGGSQLQAGIIADEAIEALRSIREQGWNQFQSSSVIVSMSGGKWVMSSGASDLIDSKYTRTILLSSVCRDASKNITACPGSYTDMYSKKATVTVSWTEDNGNASSVVREFYFTNWSSANWIQTNWAGGSGQAIWSDITKYSSADTYVDNSTAGELKLANSGSASSTDWYVMNGTKYIDTTDTDFSQGTFNYTQVAGTGNDASVSLAPGMYWKLQNTQSSRVWNDVSCSSATDCWAVGNSGYVSHFTGSSWSTATTVTSAATISAVWAIASNDVWAAGASGRVWHYNGSVWSLSTTFTGRTWYDMSCTASNNCWVVGAGGYYVHYTGSWGSATTVASAADINGMWATSASDIWAAGASGRVWHYNGSVWSLSTTFTGRTWYDMSCTDSNNCWVVGAGGYYVHYTGSWGSATTVPTPANINGIWASSSTDIWAVGATGYVWHYDGSSWILYQTLSGTLNDVVCATATACWAVNASGLIYNASVVPYMPTGTFISRVFDGGTASTAWSSINWESTLPTGATLTIAYHTGNSTVPDGSWSAWSSESSTSTGTSVGVTARYIQYRATLTDSTDMLSSSLLNSVRLVYNVATTSDIFCMAANSSSDVWAGTRDGKILHYNGTSWSVNYTYSGGDWRDMQCTAANDCWAVDGSGHVGHYNGSGWSVTTVPSPAEIGGVWANSSSDVWAVGSSARIWHYNGNNWSLFATTDVLGKERWYDATCTSANSCWAVGDNGQVAKYNGTVWTTSSITLNSTDIISGVWSLSASNIWAVGNSGKIWHYNGSSWSLYTTLTSNYYYALSCASATDCYAVGVSGTIAHWSGSSWVTITSPSSTDLTAVTVDVSNASWIGGSGGILMTKGGASSYNATAALISSAYNMGVGQLVQAIEWDENLPSGTDIRLQLRTAPDASGSPGAWTNWRGVSGDGTYFTDPSGTLTPVDTSGNQWVQYRAELTGTLTDTPELFEVRINY